jgi:hypothetical protein
MAAGGSGIRHDADVDLYGVLGLKKECSDADLRIAYRRLAMVSAPAASCQELITFHFAHLPLVADMASGQVLRVRQLGDRGGGQGAVPGDPGRILRS